MKRVLLAGAFGLAAIGVAGAQSQAPQGQAQQGAGASDPYVTSTGETVDTPGQSHSAGVTRMDRRIMRENNRIDDSICKGC